MQKFNVNEFAAKVNNHINEATTQGFLDEASSIEEALYFTLKYNCLLEGDYVSPLEVEREELSSLTLQRWRTFLQPMY